MGGLEVRLPLTHGSLFSGIGGFDYAAELAGWTNLFNCEIDTFCRTVLNYHFPNAQQFTDIKTTDFSLWRGKIDILSGGFPCQPFSQAGLRRGTEDNRYLWPEMLRAICEVQPRWIVGENVLGIVNWNGGMVFEQVCSDLEVEGYQIQPFVLPACGVNAPHRRYRTFFVAYRPNSGTQDMQCRGQDRVSGYFQSNASHSDIDQYHAAERSSTGETSFVSPVNRPKDSSSGQPCGANSCNAKGEESSTFATDTDCSRFQTARAEQQTTGTARGYTQLIANTTIQCWLDRQSNECGELPRFDGFPTQSPVCGRDDGFSDLLDADAVYQGRAKVNIKNPFARWRTESIKSYGNAIVPPLVYQIFNAINAYEAELWES